MENPEIMIMLSKHIAGQESKQENEKFTSWLNENESNKTLFNKIKNALEDSEEDITKLTFRERFTKQKMKDFIYKQAIGNLVGFIVGMWVTTLFSHYVLERRGLNNLFGLAGRKKVAVNIIPEWMQGVLAILLGFIALELINHFFQTKKHLKVWIFLKKQYSSFATKN